MVDFTKIARYIFKAKGEAVGSWRGREQAVQRRVLLSLLRRASSTEIGREADFTSLLRDSAPERAFTRALPLRQYEDFRPTVMRMVEGEPDLLWPGRCDCYAQSSGTTGGRSKYVPVTSDGLRINHYGGAAYTMGLYLRSNPKSRIFSGKGLVLGGSFATELHPSRQGVRIGDLSATLINRINPVVNIFRVPDKKTALLSDWSEKMPLLAEKAARADVTNISGVPSWMLRVLLKVKEAKGAETLAEVWPNLEVFFHGGISFGPYRAEYEELCRGLDMHFFETYNASEGYFASADGEGSPGMQLLLDCGVYYEFLPLGAAETVGVADVREGKVYELVVSTVNGLWRYRTGDTVKIESVSPLRISIAGRTRSFINAFGEELMEDNAEKAIGEACRLSSASIVNYSAAPVYAEGGRRGRHQWIIEWQQRPADTQAFAAILDSELRKVNSDYDAKRTHTIFLDPPEIVDARSGLFDCWLNQSGSHKLGGQRKVPRLSNDRTIADRLLELNSESGGCE